MEKILGRLKENRNEWIVIAALLVVVAILLYFSIGMSVSIGNGYTLFGDTSYTGQEAEIQGPTGSDITVLSLFWVLTVLLLALFVYRLVLGIRHLLTEEEEKVKIVRKTIVNGRTVVVKEERKDDQGRTGKDD